MKRRLLAAAVCLIAPLAQAATDAASNIAWVALASVLVFFMLSGFALVQSGMAGAKNIANVMMTNHLNACVAGLLWGVSALV